MSSASPIGTKIKFTAKEYDNVIYTTKITTVTMSPSEGLLIEPRTYIINKNTYKTNLIGLLQKKTPKALSVCLFNFKCNRSCL